MISDAIDVINKRVCEDGTERIPKINPKLGESPAYHRMRDLHVAVHKHFSALLSKDKEPDLPENFTYLNEYEILTPEEDYLHRGRDKIKSSVNGKDDGFQYLPTDTYTVRYKFQIDDTIHPVIIHIPFVKRGGIMRINGVKYGIGSVMKTRGISNVPGGYFISFDSNNVKFTKMSSKFMVNGTQRQYTLPVTEDMHRHTKSGSKKFVPPLALWQFARYGVSEVFKRFLDLDVSIFDADDEALQYLDTNEWAVCKSVNANPRMMPCPYAVVLPKDKLDKKTEIYVGTLFYVASFYPDRIQLKYIDNPTIWKLLLAYSVHGENAYPDQRHLEMIDTHLNDTVENFLDDNFKAQLRHEGLEFENTYELFDHVISLYTKDKSTRATDLANAWGRYITVTEYILRSIRHSTRDCMWKLKAAARSQPDIGVEVKRGLRVSGDNIRRIMNIHIRPEQLTKINTGLGNVAPIQITTDNMVVGLTTRCVDEKDAIKTRGDGKKTIDLTDPSKHVHASWLEVGSVTNLIKSMPFGLAILNPYLQLNTWGKVVRKEENIKLLNAVHSDLLRKGHERASGQVNIDVDDIDDVD